MFVQVLRATLPALICIALITASDAQDPHPLGIGETRLPSGVVVREGEDRSSALALKKQLHEQLSNRPLTLRLSFEEFAVNLKLLTPLNNWSRTIPSVCDEYAATHFLFYDRGAVPVKKLVINMEAPQLVVRQKCEYDIKDATILYQDRPLRASWPASQSIPSGSSVFSITPLSKERSAYVQLPLVHILIAVPFPLSETPRLERFLMAAAEQLYSGPDYQGSIVRFIAVQNGTPPRSHLMPAYQVMAFRSPKGQIFLINDIRLQITVHPAKGASEEKRTEYVSIRVFNLRLADALAAGKAFAGNLQGDLFQDAGEVVETAGRYAADAFQVSQVVVNLRAFRPGSQTVFEIPVKFEREADSWQIRGKGN